MELGRLKSKSLLENLGDETNPTIGMHDLWRGFCVAETKRGDLVYRRWVYEAQQGGELAKTTLSGTCWERVKQMAFLDCKLRTLLRLNFSHFLNIRVLKITRINMTQMVVVDLSRLMHLKSLEVTGRHLQRLVFKGLPKGLFFFSLVSGFVEVLLNLVGDSNVVESSSSREWIWGFKEQWELGYNSCQLIKQIASLNDLRILAMMGYGGCKFKSYDMLRRLPNLQKLSKLQRLNILNCSLITEVPGLGDLVALKHLMTGEESKFYYPISPYRLELPDMRKLVKLQVLSLHCCCLKAVLGFDCLTSLQKLVANF